ncbi:hypothetical protein [Shewanella waksmanii]|uniref:hypothetical protein n=1 Tax=Shewanella waksmanii TaxID=213783 RepID=UPI0037361430
MTTLFVKLKNQLSSGLLVLMPLLLFYLVAQEIADLMITLSTPLTSLVPSHGEIIAQAPLALACIALLLAAAIIGLLMHNRIIRELLSNTEQATLAKIPLYQAIKAIGRGLLGDKSTASYTAGLFTNLDDSLQWVYVIEETDKFCTILLPNAPSGFSGPVKMVPRHNVQIANYSIAEVSGVLTQWGQDSLGHTCMSATAKTGKDKPCDLNNTSEVNKRIREINRRGEVVSNPIKYHHYSIPLVEISSNDEVAYVTAFEYHPAAVNETPEPWPARRYLGFYNTCSMGKFQCLLVSTLRSPINETCGH